MLDLNLSELDKVSRLLMTIPLRPVQGDRFQPTGFPSLGAATYQAREGPKLLVESAQSMANRLETTCWDAAQNAPVEALNGLSHVTVTHKGGFWTDTMLEAHRLNSAYLLEGKDKAFLNKLTSELGGLDEGPINRKKLAEVLLKYDVGSLIHGVFLAKKDLAGGRLRVARALSAFIEASGVQVAASGGVKNDHVHPGKVEGDSKNHFGNIPFSRDEYIAERIDCHINLDLAQIRGYGLDPKVQKLLILLALYRVRKLFDGDLRLRTACDLEPVDRDNLTASRPNGFKLPLLTNLEAAVKSAIPECKDKDEKPLMVHTTVTFEDELKKAKDEKKKADDNDDDSDDDTDETSGE
jgi:CRISPR-associated protein Csb1